MSSDKGRLFPVCCSAEIPYDAVNEFLLRVREGQEREYWSAGFVVVEDLHRTYMEASIKLDRSGQFSSPFVGRSLEEIATIVRDLRHKTDSDINYVHLIVLDGEAITKQWAYMVFASDAELQRNKITVDAIKAEYGVIDTMMRGLSVSSPSFNELKEIAGKEKDSVLRRFTPG